MGGNGDDFFWGNFFYFWMFLMEQGFYGGDFFILEMDLGLVLQGKLLFGDCLLKKVFQVGLMEGGGVKFWIVVLIMIKISLV